MTRENERLAPSGTISVAGCSCLPPLVLIYFSLAALEMQKRLISLFPRWDTDSDHKVTS